MLGVQYTNSCSIKFHPRSTLYYCNVYILAANKYRVRYGIDTAMDSQPPADGFLLEIVDNEWREDVLPNDHIWVPTEKLPDPEADNSDSHLTMSEQELRWTDLSLSNLAPELAISDNINIPSS